jgi:phosphate transport system substrate-binding protein
LYNKWISVYGQANPKVKIAYEGVGSGAGIKRIMDEGVDFAGTDSPMKDDQITKAAGGPVVHLPMTAGAAVVAYNLPDVKESLKLNGPVLADIYLGEITKWNDPKIAALNPGITLAATEIVPVYRSDSSGTTANFTDYLCQVSPAWKEGPGKGSQIKWPMGTGANKTDGVAEKIKATPGSIGYLELGYALANKVTYAQLQNKAGKFIVASPASVSAAAAVKNIPDDLRFSIINAEGEDAYPLASLTWIVVYKTQKDAPKAAAMSQFLTWAIHDGQNFAEELHYAKLPASLIPMIDKKIQELGGK